LQWLGNVGNIL